VIAFTNPGGIRTDIAKKQDGAVTYADLFASQPFRNQLVTLTLTGMQDQGRDRAATGSTRSSPRILQVSKGSTCMGRRKTLWRPCDIKPDGR